LSLNNIPDGILLLLTKTLFPTMEIMWANDLLYNLLLQGIISDADFRNGIFYFISQLQDGIRLHHWNKKSIVSKVLYYQSNPVFPCSGDIIRATAGNQSCLWIIKHPIVIYQIQKQNILSLLSLLTTLQLILAIK